jgi:hypothetical protein
MYLTGHTGLTLGAAMLLNRGKRPMSNRKIGMVMGFALMPDILDRLVYLVVPGYPDHGVFHSVFFYALALPLAFVFMRRALPYVAIMTMHVFCDLANVSPKTFLYPLYGWLKPVYGVDPDLDFYLRGHLPAEFLCKFPFGHYLVFEALGAIVILAVLIGRLGGRRAVIYLPGNRDPEPMALAEVRSDVRRGAFRHEL